VERDRIISILESVIFVSGRPLSLQRLMEMLPGTDRRSLQSALGQLMARSRDPAAGVALVEVAGGYQFRTKPENSEYVRSFLKSKPQRMSRPTLETLSIIAYRQPVTRTEIEAIRGVDVGGVLGTLLERRLIQIMGRKDVIGRPFVYGTTKEFLEFFGLKDLSNLPSLKELEELGDSREPVREDESLAIPEARAEKEEANG
jgi:segregation and condensation protein B